MKKNILILFFIGIIFMLFCKCTHNLKNKKFKYFRDGRFLVKDTYEDGVIKITQYFNADTMPDGPEINYYPNGDVKKWKWFNGNKVPCCNVYFFEDKKFDTCQGSPFLGTYYDTSYILWVRTIKAPYLSNITLGYRDYFNGKLIRGFGYKYLSTDTGLLFPLIDHKPQKEHKYKLSYCVFDDRNNMIFMFETYLQNDADKN